MLPFADRPYTFTPPSYFAPTAWFLRAMSTRFRLPRVFRIRQFNLLHADRVRPDVKTRLVLIANHSTHIDAPLLIEACHRVGVKPRTMAAYDVYLRGRFDAFVLRRLGCFSVDREASDKQALDEAAKTIEQGRFSLTLFPEGNVYLENDHVTPFQDGAALLAVRGAKALAEQGVRVVIQPVALKLTHMTDCRPALVRLIDGLAQRIGVKLDRSMSPADALGLIARSALRQELTARGIEPPTSDDLPAMVRLAASRVLDALEGKLEIEAKPDDDAMDRVRRARRVIHEALLDTARSAENTAMRQHANEAMLAFRIASYSPTYVREKPTLDRIGEWVEKLHEDLHDVILPAYANRAATLSFAEPIDVSALLASGIKQKQLIGQLTQSMEQAIQRELDAINAANTLPGGTLWTSAIG
ncbi:MAG: 1-acyl-sn-glycerol-3-phosphate acyltransferase [Tepidisphaeraceae bacterium]